MTSGAKRCRLQRAFFLRLDCSFSDRKRAAPALTFLAMSCDTDWIYGGFTGEERSCRQSLPSGSRSVRLRLNGRTNATTVRFVGFFFGSSQAASDPGTSSTATARAGACGICLGVTRKYRRRAPAASLRPRRPTLPRVSTSKPARSICWFLGGGKRRVASKPSSTTGTSFRASHLRSGVFALSRIRVDFKDWLDKPMPAINAWLVGSWVRERTMAGKRPATIRRDIQRLQAAISKAVGVGDSDQHPFKGVKLPRIDRRGRVRYLSADEEAALRSALGDRGGRPARGSRAVQRMARGPWDQAPAPA